MRVSIYITPRFFAQPTGQMKHAMNMASCLAKQPGMEVILLAAKDQLTPDGKISIETPINGLPIHPIPVPSKLLHYLWRTFHWPYAEYWCGPVDWVYCPTEMFVPARKARTAATIHCADWFENDLPWSNAPENLKGRKRMGKVFTPIVQRADLICTVSEFLKGRIVELLSAEKARVAVVGNGVEANYFKEPFQFVHSLEQPPFLLVVAPPSLRKGFDYLLKLAAELDAQNTGVVIKVVGDGLPPGMSYDMAYKKGLAEAVQLLRKAESHTNIIRLGYMDSKDLAPLMRQSLALVILSRYETFGIPAVEAMAAGTPVISAKYAALPEVVNRAGVLVNAENEKFIVMVIMDLLKNEKKRSMLIESGKRRAQEFTWDVCASRLVDAFKHAGNYSSEDKT